MAQGESLKDVVTNVEGWRVKLYELESSGTWIDLGVGYVSLKEVDEFKGPALCVMNEGDRGRPILISKLLTEDLYEKQGETIILWKEQTQVSTVDYALSFQDPRGCHEIWEGILEWQGINGVQQIGNIGMNGSGSPHGRLTRANRTGANGSLHSDSENSSMTVMDDNTTNTAILPADIFAEKALEEAKSRLETLPMIHRDSVFAQLLQDDWLYLKNLCQLFQQLEERSNQATVEVDVEEEVGTSTTAAAAVTGDKAASLMELATLADVMRLILLMNDPTVIEFLLSDEVFESVAGIFEYDRALKERGNYRSFLFGTVALKEVTPLPPDLRSTAKLLFRLRYLKDILLHPSVDEPGVLALNSMIVFAAVEIATKLFEETETDGVLVAALRAMAMEGQENEMKDGESTEHRRSCFKKQEDAARLVRDAFVLSSFVTIERRAELYSGSAFLCTSQGRGLLCSALVKALAVPLAQDGDDIGIGEKEERLAAAALAQTAAEALHAMASVHSPSLRSAIMSDCAACSTCGGMGNNSSSDGSNCNSNCLLGAWLHYLVNGADSAALELLGEALRTTLDYDRPLQLHSQHWLQASNNKADKDRFLKLFYETHISRLAAPFADNSVSPAQQVSATFYHNNVAAPVDGQTASQEVQRREPQWRFPQRAAALLASRTAITDTLALCIIQHSYRAKYFLLRGQLLQKIVAKSFGGSTNSIKGAARHLPLGAVRFLKAIIKSKDEFYFRNIAKGDILRPLMLHLAGLCRSRRRDNIVASAVFDLLELIRVEVYTDTLLEYLLERHAVAIADIAAYGGVSVADGLMEKHEQRGERQQYQQRSGSSGSNDQQWSHQTSSLLPLGAEDIEDGSSGFGNNVRSRRGHNRHGGFSEADVEEQYFFGDDSENDPDQQLSAGSPSPRPSPSRPRSSSPHGSLGHNNGNGNGSNRPFSPASSASSPSSSMIPGLKVQLTLSRPASPPHYSQLRHGSPLDGESNFQSNNTSTHHYASHSHSSSGEDGVGYTINSNSSSSQEKRQRKTNDDKSENENENLMQEVNDYNGDKCRMDEEDHILLPSFGSSTADDDDEDDLMSLIARRKSQQQQQTVTITHGGNISGGSGRSTPRLKLHSMTLLQPQQQQLHSQPQESLLKDDNQPVFSSIASMSETASGQQETQQDMLGKRPFAEI